MASFGEGYRYHVTGLAHDETGFPTNNHKIAGQLTERLVRKVKLNIDDFSYYEEYRLEDAETVIVAYGGVSRSAMLAIDRMREQGRKVGMFRPITIWPVLERNLKPYQGGLRRYTWPK